MATTFKRRRRRANTANESKFFRKENVQEQSFFSGSHDGFFQPQAVVQRKCEACEQEDKKAQRSPDKKEEDKQVHRDTDKKEDDKQVHHTTDKKEEDKEVHRTADKNDEDKQVRRSADKKEDDDKKLHRQADGSGAASSGTANSYIQSMSGKGSPMPRSAQQFFAAKMGHDFSSVRIHTGHEASESAKDINARAYAVGNHIVFKDGQYNPETHEGKKLLAHELTHVLQQSDMVMRNINSTITEEDDKKSLGHVRGHGTNTSNKRNYGGNTTVNIQAHTDANYDHGSFSASNVRSTRATGCGDCGSAPCARMTGVMVSVFQANPQIPPPSIPGGLTPCQRVRVQDFITNVLMPHEQRHVAAFNTYNGTVNTPFSVVGCHTEQALNDLLTPIHNGIDTGRIAAANTLSDALDPFNGTINIDCQEPAAPAPKK